MKLTQTLLTAAAIGCCALSASADTTFTFYDSSTTIGAALSGQSSGSFTVSDIEITATASTDTFNATGSGFGINQAAGGDDTDGFDFTETAGDGIAEGFTLSFDQDVYLVDFSVYSWSVANGDEVSIMDNTTLVATITSTGSTSLGDYLLSENSELTIMTTAGIYGNGWSFDSITVSAVPEPSTFALLSGFCALGFVMLRRRSVK
jgi:hypothetical protein